MKKLLYRYRVIWLLMLIFSAPGLFAYVFYQHPNWLGAAATNKGTLLNPPLLLSPNKTSPKWRLLLNYNGPCDNQCKVELDRLARIRLALGRRLYNLDVDILEGVQPLIYIENPEGYAILSYPLTTDSHAILHDMKRLIKG